jgi:amphi-Trp domain-containing protein
LEDVVKDLKFEQKSSLSRLEAAELLDALAAALRHGDGAELELGPGTVSLRIPDELRSEIEIEVGDGEIEVEIEFKWPVAHPDKPAPAKPASDKPAPAKPGPAKPGPRPTPGPKGGASSG